MADLDDFFAKKDRKGKNKKKVKPIESLEKKLEDVNRTNQERSKKVQDDDEWNDYEEEKDYSGLKIQALSLEEEEARREAQEAKHAAEQVPDDVWTGEKAEKPAAKPAPKPANDDDEPDFIARFRERSKVHIDSVIEFPSLGTPDEAYQEIKGFQAVRSGATNLDSNQAARDNIKTANKFSALRD